MCNIATICPLRDICISEAKHEHRCCIHDKRCECHDSRSWISDTEIVTTEWWHVKTPSAASERRSHTSSKPLFGMMDNLVGKMHKSASVRDGCLNYLLRRGLGPVHSWGGHMRKIRLRLNRVCCPIWTSVREAVWYRSSGILKKASEWQRRREFHRKAGSILRPILRLAFQGKYTIHDVYLQWNWHRLQGYGTVICSRSRKILVWLQTHKR